MFPFKRIFNFAPATVARMEQRLDKRYAPGAAFPLDAGVVIAGREWPAKVRDLSVNGVGLTIPPEAQPAEGSVVTVRLGLGAHQQRLGATLVHVRPGSDGVSCGAIFKFADFLAQKTYLQLLQPVAIGQSLQPVAPELVIQNEPRFLKKVFRGDEQAMLTVWFEKGSTDPLHSFEFQMDEYFCHVDGKSGVLEAYERAATDSHKGKLSNPVFDISGSLHAEIRQLFRWILPNLSPQVPEDIRAFLSRFA